MYLALAGFGMKWDGEDFERVKLYVDNKNKENKTNKFCIVELDPWDWAIYKRSKNLFGCHPTVVYDPEGVAKSVLKMVVHDINFVRNFGGKSRDTQL